jgi:hypothetical protein
MAGTSKLCAGRDRRPTSRRCARASTVSLRSARPRLHDGWAAGAELAAINVKKADVSRVLLLSDGNANAGLTDIRLIADRCAQMASVGVSTSPAASGRPTPASITISAKIPTSRAFCSRLWGRSLAQIDPLDGHRGIQ